MRVAHSLLALLIFAGLFGAVFAVVSAQDDLAKTCPEGFPDEPAFDRHMSQAAIAAGEHSFEDVFDHGAQLFEADFNYCDGRGRPATTGANSGRAPEDQPEFHRISAPDANSCAGCHNEPRIGGGGDIVANVFVLAQAADPVVDSTSAEFSNFRNTLGMFGTGGIEMLAREMTADLHALRDATIEQAQSTGEPVTIELLTKGVSFGQLTAMPDGTVDTSECEGVDHDLVVKPFHQAGVVVSLREFTVNAMNHHHGMQAEERFDLIPERGVDFDQDGIATELTLGDITASTIWQASLGVPGQVLPADPAERAVVERGEELFDTVGCTSCHIPELQLESNLFTEPNPYNPAGTFTSDTPVFSFDLTSQGEGPFLESNGAGGAIVRAYTDLKRHNLCDAPDHPEPIRYYCNEQLAQNRPEQDGNPGTEYFLTRRLWDVGNSSPYGHTGQLSTITEAILAHGGEGRVSRDAFAGLPFDDQVAVVQFLKSLQALPVGSEAVVYEDEYGTVPANSFNPGDNPPPPPGQGPPRPPRPGSPPPPHPPGHHGNQPG
jgi:hypothetical protein